MSTSTAPDAFSITYTTHNSTLQATFTACTPHNVEPALVAAWAVVEARSLELKSATFNLNGAKCIVEIDVTWSIDELLSTARTQMNAFGEEASNDVRCEISINAPETQTCPVSIECTTYISESVEIIMCFDTKRIDERTARLTSSRYAHVLSQLLRGQAKNISQLSIFSHEDWQVVSTLNPTAPALVRDTVHGMFTRQAQATPNSIAIESWDGTFTYAELDALSTQLASSLGEKREFIAICFEKTRWSLVAIFAILKSGAAYFAVDPAYPQSRIETILGVVKAELILVSPAQQGVCAGIDIETRVVDEAAIAALPAATAEPRGCEPEDPVAIVFTSGTTGTPKGVVLTHVNLATHITTHLPLYNLGAHSRWLQFATLTFDASFLEIFSPLASGGCVCIPTDADRLNDLEGAINRLRANSMFLTTTMASMLDPKRTPTIDTLLVGGEPVTEQVIAAWGGRHLHQIYGPSECTIFCHVYPNITPGVRPNNLGRPVVSTTYIVDPEDHDRLVPFGATGELVIAGPILGRGYLHEPEKTAAAWIENPGWEFPGCDKYWVPERIYKTGDLVSYDADGNVLYGSRKDTQTKLRGQRLELGEIEVHLSKHPNVLQCAVFHPKSGPGKHRIAALVRFTSPPGSSSNSDSGFGSSGSDAADDASSEADTLCGGDEVPVISGQGSEVFWKAVEDLETHLAELLPQYMVPNVWIGTEKLPMTFTGKVDRTGATRWIEELPESSYQRLIRSQSSSDIAEAVTHGESVDIELELKMRGIWSEALNFPIERIPLDAPFFQLGGDSITAMQVVSRCTQADIPVSVQQVLQCKTISRLVENIHSSGALTQKRKKILDVLELNTPFQLSPIQNMMFKLQPDGVNHHNQGFLVRLMKPIAPTTLTACIDRIVEAHPMLRARYERRDGEWVQYITDEIRESYSLAAHTISSLDDIEPIVQQRQRVFEVSSGPIFSADVFEGQEKQILLLNAHHLVIDLVSWRVILQDLEDLLQQGDSIKLTQGLSFQTWAKLQYENSKSARIEDILPFTPPPKLNLREYWGLDVKNVWRDNAETSFRLSPQMTELFLRDANEPFDTAPMDILLTALSSSFLETFADRESLLVHPEGHGREAWDPAIDLSRTVGWFTVIYPLLMHQTSDPLELLQHAKTIRKKSPAGGRPFFAAWHHSEHHREDDADFVSPIEILFNYHGGYQQLHRKEAIMQRVTEIDVEHTMNSPDLHRYALFEIEAAIEGEQLVVHLIYNQRIKRVPEVLRWVQNWEQHLLALLDNLASQVEMFQLESPPSGNVEFSELENKMLSMWCTVLGMDKETAAITREQNFLNLGADNFDAMKLVSLARESGWLLDLEKILETPKLKDMVVNMSLIEKGAKDYGEPPKSFELMGNETEVALAKQMICTRTGYRVYDIEDIYPSAPLQEALVALSILTPGSYTTDHVYQIPADLDIPRFKAAWEATVAAHAVLRTQFTLGDHSRILQVVLKDQPLDWAEDTVRPLLEFAYNAPLTRYSLYDVGTPNAKFVWTIHHTLADGWAFELITADATSAYRHGTSTIPQTPRTPYSCFIHYLQNVNMEESLDFWRNNLDGYIAADFPPVKSSPQEREHETADTKTLIRTVRLSLGAKGFTGATLLRAAWALLLSRVANTDDVCFGATVTGRMVPIPGIETMVGPTIQTLPTRMRVDAAMPVLEFLEGIQKGYIETIPHEHVGLQNIARLGESAKAACAAKTMLVVQPPPSKEGDEEVVMKKIEAVFDANYALALNCWQLTDAVKIELSYDCLQVEESMATRVLSQFECLLEEITDTLQQGSLPSPSLNDLNSFSAEDAKQLQEFNDNIPTDLGEGKWSEQTVHAVIERNARLHPDAPALDGWDGKLTYLELNMLSSRLASYLKSKNVGPETLVPVVFKKSVWFNVAVLAVWKAGAAYVPIDPTQPLERLSQMIATISTRAVVALSAPDQHDFTEQLTHLQTIPVTQAAILSLHAPSPPTPPPPTNPNCAAYVIFTSGSTGRPKGVVVEFGALYASAKAQVVAMRLTPECRLLAFCSYIWDVHVLENFITLFAGACLCVASDQERTDNLVGALQRFSATRMTATPTTCELIDPAELPLLNTLVVGGEAMAPRLIARLSPHMRLMNAYGPTEAAITSNINSTMTVGSSPKNIGFPVGSKSWIVDPGNHNRILPVGSVGELALSGPCLARGYIDLDAETAKAFIDHPKWSTRFPSQKIDRIYLTGDLARFNDDGSVEFFGRKDAQVKVNGIRIELGEIEHHVASLASRECAVEAVPRGGSKVLVSFIRWDEATEGSFTDFKINAEEELQQRLPAYMIPSLWVPLPALPMQQGSNKVDRRKLRGFFSGMKNAEMNRFACPTGQRKRVVNPPANQLEKRLRDLWATILDMNPEEVGRDDHFFRLQGDSVAAIRLVSEARRAGLQISTKQIFQNPVLADMAAVLEFVESELDEESLVPPFSMIKAEVLDIALDEAAAHCLVEREQIEDLMPCSPMQMGLIASSFAESGTYVVNHVSSLPADLDLARFKSAWEQAMAANAILRTRIIQAPSCNDDFLQVVMNDTSIPWDFIPRNEWDAYLERIIDQKHFSGSRLITFGLTTDQFVLNVHHALYDAGSLLGVFEHFAQGYRGEPLKPRAPYRNFVKYIQTLDPAESEALWRRELDGAAGTNFPVPENPNAPELEPESAQIEQHIEFGETYAGIYTLGTMLRAAWALVISRHTRKEDICFRETLSGKTAPVVGIDNIAGPTICTVPFRVQLTDEITVGEYLDNVNSYATRIMGHEHIGIQNISHLSPDCEAACQFRSLLVIQPDDSAQSHLGFGIEKLSSEMAQNIPLILEFVLLGDRVKLTARYDTNIIERSQVSCILGHIENALKRLITAEDEMKVTAVSLFGKYDEGWIAQLDNPTPPPGEDGYIAMFMRQARETPEREAVCAHDGSFSYAQLAYAVEALSSHFIDAGITKGTTIALCFEKSKWVIVFILATMRAGACYVSLDPGSPAARITLILNSCKPQYIFSAPHKVALFDGLPFRLHPVNFDYMAGFIDTVVVNRERVIVEDRANPIYMIFTSGSTGTPKGVVIQNAAVADFSLRYKDAADITRDTRTLQFSAYTFDAAVVEIFVPLIVGGCICIPSEEDRTGDLAGAMESMRATWTLLLPSVASVLDPADVPTLKTILLGGEAPTLNDFMRWYGKDVRNAYGPTECTCLSLLTRPGAITAGASPGNLGYQTNCSVWVVNIHDRTQLAGVGEIGELAISGFGLALGYLGDKEKTEKTFYNAPWLQGRSTTRCYLTGDLVRYAADGTIIFSGRKDNQIKLRGFRIELGEIEHHLIQQTEIGRGAVLLNDKGEHKQKLVAVFSLAGQDKKADSGAVEFEFKVRKDVKKVVDTLQSALQGKLPSYMVPTMWVAVEALPATVVGKIDRRMISSWLETYKSEEEEEEERNIVEVVEDGDESATRKKLRKIWSEILDRPENKIKPDMSFFRMGGDSISAIRLVSRFKRENINITSKQIKKLKTIANIEAAIKEAGGFVEEEVVAKTVSYEPFELGPIQKMHFDLTTAGHPGFSQTTMLKVNGRRLDATTVARAVEGLVMHHTALRTTFLQDTAGSWKQKISQSATNAFRVAAHQSEDLESLRDVAVQAQEEFDLRNGHVLNVYIFNVGEQQQYLLVSAHHLVIDFVSWKNVINDLETLISSNGKEALAPVPVTYNDWTSAITQHAASLPPSPSTYERDLEILEYWGIDSAEDNIYLHAAETSFSLTKSQTDTLSRYAVDNDTDFLTVLLATLAASFWKVFPEREEMGLFLESHGRDTALNLDLSRTVGWFTTFFPLFTGGKLKNRRTAIAAFVDHFKSAREDMEDPHSYLASRYGPTWHGEKEPIPLEILFNHFGVIDSAMSADGALFEMASDVDFTVIPKDMPRIALFEITTSVAGGCLNAAVQYHQDAENEERIAAWIKSWEAGLAGLGEAEKGTKKVVKGKKGIVNEAVVGRGFKLLPRSQAEMTTLLDSALPEIGIRKEDVEDVYPCSPMQVGLILAQMRNPAEYNVDITWALSSPSGPVDVNRLRGAWSKTIKRHSLLRTVFVEDPSGVDSFLQVVLRSEAHMPTTPAGQMVHPLGGYLAHRLLVEDSEPVRMTLQCSHAIYDAYSNGILLGDLVKAYEGTLDGKPAPGYGLFINYLKHNSSEAADKKFWSEYLKDAEISHFPKLAEETTDAELASIDWAVADSPAIIEFCRENDTTPALFFKFIWSLVLRLYTGNDVVSFGSLVDGRDPDFAGVEGIVGPLINTLICKAGLQGGKKAVDAMMELQEASEDGSEHQRAGLAQVEGWVGLQGMHVFNTVMTFYMESVHSSTQDPEGDLKLEHTGGEDKSDYPVVLKVAKKQNEFFVQIDYHTTHLDVAHAKDVSRLMNSMIQQVVAHPEMTINEIQRHNPALYTATQHCCAIVHPKDDARLLPSGLRGLLVLQMPGMPGFTPTGQTARYDRRRSVSDVRALDEFCRVRGFEVDLSKVEQAFERMAGIKQFIAVPVGVARNVVKLAVYVCFEAEAPAGAAWDAMASELRTGAKGRLPHGYQHLVTIDLLVPIGGCKGTMTRQAVLGVVTGQLADKTISVGDTARVEKPETAKVEDTSSSIEVALREVFSKVLDTEPRKIKNTTNFFEIGGDSLTAMQLVQQMKKRGFKISHGDVLRFPMLESMALKFSAIGSAKKEVVEEVACAEVKPFSMLKSTPKQLQQLVHPVEDAYPTTFFQKWSFNHSMSSTRGNLAHFIFDIPGALNRPRLETACKVLVSRNEILRTVFLEEASIQAVFRADYSPEISFDLIVSDLEVATTSYIAQYGAIKTVGEPIVRFHILATPQSHRLIMRITHAQFDGLSMLPLMAELQHAYTTPGSPLPRKPTPASFIAASARTITPMAQTYWQQRLAGTSGMTSLSLPPSDRPHKMHHLIYTAPKLTNASFAHLNATFTTALKTAWASTLAKHTGKTDVLFANLVSARTVDVENISDLITCAINYLPVRIAVPEPAEPKSLLSSVQSNHAESMPYEAMDYSAICSAAGWAPDGSALKTVVQHQNMQEVDEGDAGIGDVGARWAFKQNQPLPGGYEAWVVSVQREGGMDVGLGFDEAVLDSQTAKKLITALGECLEKMAGVSGGGIKVEEEGREKGVMGKVTAKVAETVETLKKVVSNGIQEAATAQTNGVEDPVQAQDDTSAEAKGKGTAGGKVRRNQK